MRGDLTTSVGAGSAGPTTTLLTGATGFLGRHVMRLLTAEPDGGRLVGCVRPGGWDGPPPVGWALVEVDLAAPDGPERLRSALPHAGPVRLLHLAGDYRSADPNALWAANVRTTLAALEALTGRLVHVVYTSSVAVYGSHHRHHGHRWAAPDTCYGRAKRLAETALDLFTRDVGIPVAVLRLSSLYGAGNPGGNAIAALTGAIAHGRPFVVRPAVAPSANAGLTRRAVYARDYLHVTDAARAVVAASRARCRGLLDVGSGVTASPYQLADVARALGRRVELSDEASGASVVRFACDSRDIRAVLGLPVPLPLADGIADELAWRLLTRGPS
ncbi:NAD-dependent epimerase/dehydratase family protein [Micromonospora tulbaghiae]|uniref:NAD-dependent epimerase/dehydratase family protein n=1 Tax=Micromonospora tulbaghiae TaxID=479978 RepID=UPI00364F35F0